MGGALSEDCGYKMEPIVPFCEVLENVSKHSKSKEKSKKRLFRF